MAATARGYPVDRASQAAHAGHASVLEDLRIPPANRLEAIKGIPKGQHSIRINDHWRICFRWIDGDAYDVEVVDCH